MPRFVFLGTSGAIPSAERDTTSLVFAGAGAAVLVDCGGSPVGRLRRAGVDPLAVSHVVLTHIHPDHAYGLPSLVQNLFLLHRTAPLTIVCRPEHVSPIRALLALFNVLERPGIFPIVFAPIALAPGAAAFATGGLAISTAPNAHGTMPNFAIRVEAPGARTVVYSSDTTPCETVAALARGADTLLHEATFPHRARGRFGAHSTAREAGEVAARAGVARLILTHVEADYHGEVDALVEEARAAFGGPVEMARELEPYPM
ncbi:MAG: MBL fold metallo-hydrolase [Candidatus Rokubacteria bacterium]|nr:MBL fold metallo-hydrolase [Candidatus Rokubacteria bacterium]MBI3825994.1 MBL fold metallo-hydrolase [Candidatus Rokubacteria bacterium]